jgi:hypothetical protein
MELLKFDELTLNEEVKSMRKHTASGKQIRGQDKLIIHMLYLLTSRFTSVYDHVLRLIQTFIEQVGADVDE